ncbi:sensor histidine kinase [Paenibacillus sp. FA6]|uniref:sensor histidine kinase n=1 Tax=Paenibacillus sp. FA6 TaxID=3413029 RepID=UPI003F655215
MTRFKQTLLNLSLRNKLIISFSCFIITSFFIIGGTLSWLYFNSNKEMILDATEENNRQIINNIDTSLNPLMRLSMYPLQDKKLLQILRKDYSAVTYPKLEISQDFNAVNQIIKNSMLLNTDLIESVVIYQAHNHLIIGRSNTDLINYTYFENEFMKEPYIQEIMQKKGIETVIGIHPERLMTSNDQMVVSIGRAIIDPNTYDNLGVILINVGIDKLKKVWSNTHFTENTKFYLIDESEHVIYSQDSSQIGKSSEDILEETKKSSNYIITSSSKVTNWKAVTVIPKNELFRVLDVMIETIIIALLVLLVLAIVTSVVIATSVTKPLAILQHKMKRVSQGDMDVVIDIQHGEVGKISITIDHMLEDIRRLIQRIYEEETEKRRLESLALQSQIKPHFIYNTINVIKWMAKIQGSTGIEEALTDFSSVIKFTAKTESEYTTFQEEVDFITSYTRILDFRYLNKFEVSYDIEHSILQYRTLKFLIQPLVENAVFHGFDGVDYKGKLLIHIYQQADNVVVLVSDNGRGMSMQEQDTLEFAETSDHLNSIGIKNVRRRIELYYGEGYGLWIESKENMGTTAKIIVPILKNDQIGDKE